MWLSTHLREVNSLYVGWLRHRPHALGIAEEAVDVEPVSRHGELLFLSIGSEQVHFNFVRQADVVFRIVLVARRIGVRD